MDETKRVDADPAAVATPDVATPDVAALDDLSSDAAPTAKPRGLARTIAKSGYGTRPQAEGIVRAGRVRVDGVIVRDPHAGIPPTAEIRIDGQRIAEVLKCYFAFHKPAHLAVGPGERDKRRSMTDHFPTGIRGLRPSARLDAESTGLVLLSNDSLWNTKAAGGAGLDKEYVVRVSGVLTELEFDLVTAGMHIPKLGFVRPLSAAIEETGDSHTVLRLVLLEGKNRQIRRLFGTLRHEVLALHRVRIGPVSLEELGPGQVRPLTETEVETIRSGQPRPRPEPPSSAGSRGRGGRGGARGAGHGGGHIRKVHRKDGAT